MALQTEKSTITSFSVTGWESTAGQKYSDAQAVEIRNYVGYITGILKIETTTEVSKLGLGWRPIVTSNPGRILPMYIDLIPHNEHMTQPDYALLANLSTNELVAGNWYYVYFVNPATPAAVPLFRDNTANDGIEIVSTAFGSTAEPSVFTVSLRVFHTEWPTA